MEYYVIDLKNCILHHAGKSKFTEKWIHYARTHHETILYAIIDGALFLKVDDEKLALQSGDVFLMKPDTPHIGYKASEVSYFWIHCICGTLDILDEAEAYHILENNNDPDKILFPCHFHLHDIEKFLILMNQLVHYTLEDYKNPIISYLFCASLIELSNQLKSSTQIERFKSRRFQEIVAYIHANFKEDLKVRTLAEQFEYNEKYLGRLFKKYFGMTTVEYINNIRLEYCALKLAETNDTVTAIAHDGGFKNEFYFMKCFKKRYSVSPSNYRNAYHLQNITRY